jgi:hypothetical protein
VTPEEVMTIDTTAYLEGVAKHQSEYSDMIGAKGRLHLDGQHNWFASDNGESLVLIKKRVTEQNGRIRVSTNLGNTFIFKRV